VLIPGTKALESSRNCMAPAYACILCILHHTQCCPTYHPSPPMPRMPFPVRHQVAILPKASSCFLKCSGIEFVDMSMTHLQHLRAQMLRQFSTNIPRNAGSDGVGCGTHPIMIITNLIPRAICPSRVSDTLFFEIKHTHCQARMQ
jgi:hypothetical protein